MITAYFTETQKYLQKDDYRKDFDVSSIEELVSKIKVSEPILIKASSKDIFDFKFKSKIQGQFEYEVVGDIIKLTPNTAKSDIETLYNGTCSYVAYKPKDKYKDLLGDKCYIVADKIKQKYFVQKGNLALTLDDLKQPIDFAKVVKIVFEGKEIEDVQIDSN